MSKFSNNCNQYMLDLEITISRLAGVLHFYLKYPDQSVDYEFIFRAFHYLPAEFEDPVEVENFCEFLKEKIEEERQLKDDIRELQERT